MDSKVQARETKDRVAPKSKDSAYFVTTLSPASRTVPGTQYEFGK